MKSSQITLPAAAALVILALAFGFFAFTGFAAENIRSREYEITVPPYQSEMMRMIQAYERLSDQYLSLVQHRLNMMEANDKQILQKIESLEKKIEVLTKQLENRQNAKNPPDTENQQ